MTPEEKAKELIDKYENLTRDPCDCLEYSCICFSVPEYKAKEMALICVNEIIKMAITDFWAISDIYLQKKYIFWLEVKEEIKKNKV